MKTKKAKDLQIGDTIRITVMGGTEDVDVEWVKPLDNKIAWYGWNPVIGEINDLVQPDAEMRIVDEDNEALDYGYYE